jgi:hypothetical protein
MISVYAPTVDKPRIVYVVRKTYEVGVVSLLSQRRSYSRTKRPFEPVDRSFIIIWKITLGSVEAQ